MGPTLKLNSGTQFPAEVPLGKLIPVWRLNLGCSFRLRADPETASHSGAEVPDVPLWSRILGCTFPDELKGESASHSEHFRGTLRYLRSHISANAINLASPLFAAASWHPRVKPRFEKIA